MAQANAVPTAPGAQPNFNLPAESQLRSNPAHRLEAAFCVIITQMCTKGMTSQGVPATCGTNRQSLDVQAIAALRRHLDEVEASFEAGLRGTIVAV
jgi:hypothetical protein